MDHLTPAQCKVFQWLSVCDYLFHSVYYDSNVYYIINSKRWKELNFIDSSSEAQKRWTDMNIQSLDSSVLLLWKIQSAFTTFKEQFQYFKVKFNRLIELVVRCDKTSFILCISFGRWWNPDLIYVFLSHNKLAEPIV